MSISFSVEDAARACARAEYEKWVAIMAEVESAESDIRVDRSMSSMYRHQAEMAVRLDIAQRLHVSEQSIWRITESGMRLRDDAPAAWTAFGLGIVDARKAQVIASAIERCRHPESVVAIDKVVADYAEHHTATELKRWLNQLVDKLEPPDTEVLDAEREKRSVWLEHRYDGMSELTIYTSSIAATAAYNRLRKTARALNEPGDDRTREQKVADLAVSWLTNAIGTESDVKAEIAVVVEAEALAGVTDTPARIDDEAVAPVSWILALAESGSTLWTRLLVDPQGHVLDVTRLGYQPPESLRHAVKWRDLRCRVNGCESKAEFADLDHDIPFDAGGKTSGENLRCLCRRHHRIKGHGVLPKTAFSPPAVHLYRLPSPPIRIDYVPAA